MRNILIVFGTRPEAIKMAPIILELRQSPNFNVKVCVTGQHKELLYQVLDLFFIEPDFDLQIMKHAQRVDDVVSKVITKMANILQDTPFDLLLVHGDTATTLGASLAAYLNRIPIAHVEAGLRSRNLMSPWPEEGNRKVVGALAKYHFSPTVLTSENLMNEGIPESRILTCGNSVIDALLYVHREISANSSFEGEFRSRFPKIPLSQKFILVTAHRRENFGVGIRNICRAISTLSAKYPDINFVYPVHPNPEIRTPVHSILSQIENVRLIEPLDYSEFVFLLSKAHIVLTDSGGIQEEAPAFSAPVLVMRDTTERPEAILSGTAKLVGSAHAKIVQEVSYLLDDEVQRTVMSKKPNPYGDGTTAKRIREFLESRIEDGL